MRMTCVKTCFPLSGRRQAPRIGWRTILSSTSLGEENKRLPGANPLPGKCAQYLNSVLRQETDVDVVLQVDQAPGRFTDVPGVQSCQDIGQRQDVVCRRCRLAHADGLAQLGYPVTVLLQAG